MAGESKEALLASLTGQSGESATAIYAKWQATALNSYHTANPTVPADGDYSLEQLVRMVLTQNAKTAQVKESLLSTILAGGAVGESVEECLLKSGLTGWS